MIRMRMNPARKLTWPDVHDMRQWARTEGWGFGPCEQAAMLLQLPAYSHLKLAGVYDILKNNAWVDLRYDPSAPPAALTEATASTRTPGLLLWVFLWLLTIRRLTGGMQVPVALGGSSYYEEVM